MDVSIIMTPLSAVRYGNAPCRITTVSVMTQYFLRGKERFDFEYEI